MFSSDVFCFFRHHLQFVETIQTKEKCHEHDPIFHEDTFVGPEGDVTLDIDRCPDGTLLLISATATSNYSGDNVQNAGMRLDIKIGPDNDTARTVAQDLCFEGESGSIDFYAAASHQTYIGPDDSGRVTAHVEPVGSGGDQNKTTKIQLTVIAIPAFRF